MVIELSFFSILELLTFSGALMLGLLFFTMKSANKKANIFLGLFLWIFSFGIFMDLLDYEMEEGALLDRIFFLISLCIAPLLYMYTYQTINKPYIKMLKYLFIPLFVTYLVILFVINSEEMIWGIDLIEYIIEIILYVLILKKLQGLKSELNNFYSELENKRLSWIKTIIYISLAFIVFDFVEGFIGFEEEVVDPYLGSISIVLSFIMVYWIAYNGFSQSEIFKASLFIHDSQDLPSESFGAHTITIDETSAEDRKLFEEVKGTIEKEKLYANSELNLRTLSESLQIKEKELSRLINIHTKTNFYHFINGFRVTEFKRLVQTPMAQQLSILGIAQEAGFSSKSTFYNTFKTLEGMTPKQYELSLKKSE
ncbi:AraC-like DNA-binding protein [Aquimarina sp. EL_43]|uniref:helix-turn-helix domain-containing protein n=1 Tax=Aquimarina TaxID=290174 RepID=UPI00046EF38B|nr:MULTISPECIES: helix-turn-helix domain-containing protein [Aquimarina]MBG6130427.1 AraC-like DNA-binding protein [Aquimarina sp. EL_35]MBG6149207.1 AraC-like DNA-binding protein [Aquimarina sp. EL_32]MBG6168419.1 AraC-like DNA-binding protein [Aquimarina sp. EL_43]